MSPSHGFDFDVAVGSNVGVRSPLAPACVIPVFPLLSLSLCAEKPFSERLPPFPLDIVRPFFFVTYRSDPSTFPFFMMPFPPAIFFESSNPT